MRSIRDVFSHGETLSIIAILAGSVGCTDLEFLQSNTCGNLVVESAMGEDCDGEEGCGKPASANECRFICETDSSACPTDLGYRCGADGVCRRSSGEFAAANTLTTATARDMLVGDVNADGCAEVIVSAMRSTTVYAFSSALSSSCVESEQTLRTNRPDPNQGTSPPPALANLDVSDESGRLSLLSPVRSLYGDGLSLHFSSGGPTLSPVLFPRFLRGAASVRTISASLHGRSVMVLLEQGSGASASDVTLVFDPQEAPMTFGGVYQGNVKDISAIVAADVDLNPNALPPVEERCEEIIIGRRDASHLELYKACTSNTTYGFTKLPSSQIALTNTAVRDSNATIVATDVDGDGYTDLLTNTQDQKVHVAFGLGDGRFHSKPPGPIPPPIADQKADVLNDPMATDAAKDERIFVALEFDSNHSGIDYYGIPCPPQTDFTSPTCAFVAGGCEAIVADIDADGDDDVIVSEGQGVDLAVHRQNGGAFNVTFLPTACPPHNLGSGDFDGDGVVDVAFFDQTSKGPEANTTSLAIAYGNAFAALGAPVTSGRFDDANGLSVVTFGSPGTGAQIGITRSIGIDDAGSALAVVEVGNERAVAAPYYLTADIMGAQSLDSYTLVAQAAGLFRQEGDAVLPALANLTQSLTAFELWLVRSNEDAGSLRAAPRSESKEIPCLSGCVLAAIPRGGSATDDLLLLGESVAVVYRVVEGGFAEKNRMVLEHGFTSTISGTNPAKIAPRPIVADVDDDGFTDVLALASSGALVGLFGTKDGFTEVELIGAPGCWGKPGCGNYAAARLDVNGDAKLDIVIAGSELPGVSTSTSVAAYEVTGRSLVNKVGISIHAEKLRSDVDYVALGAADIDADGITDIVFMPGSNFFTVLRGRWEHE